MKKLYSRKGFTLIEMLVVVFIVSLLVSVGMLSFSRAQMRARDGRRMADLEQIRAALEMYRADKGEYPCGVLRGNCRGTSGGFGSSNWGEGWATNRDDGLSCYTTDLENVLESNNYISNMPRDPFGGCSGAVTVGGTTTYYGYMYYYTTAGSNYCLYAHLENVPASSGCTGCNQAPIINNTKNFCLRNP